MKEKISSVSPRILVMKWGKMEVEGLGEGKDFKLWPGGGRQWDWSETGTDHFSGIQPDDCNELLQHNCRIIVLSRGILKRLRISKATLSYLQDHDIQTVVASTKKAVQLYNDFAEKGEAVGGLFHSTC